MKTTFNLLALLACLLLLIYGVGMWFSSSTQEKLSEMKKIALDIHTRCNESSECPFPLEGWELQFDNHMRKDRFSYRRGYYAVPNTEFYTTQRKGNEFFHIIFYPFMDFAYHASGGKDVELIIWVHTEGGAPRRLNES